MTITPLAFALSILGAIVAAVIGQRLLDYIRWHDRISSLESEKTVLKDRIGELKAEKLQLQDRIDRREIEHAKEVASITERLAKYEDWEAIFAKYESNERTGTSVEKSTGRHHCTACLNKEPPKEVPMQDIEYGWLCRVCEKVFEDPDRPKQKPTLQDLQSRAQWEDNKKHW